MARRKTEDIVHELALPITVKHGFELVDVEFLKEGSNWFLRVYIDKPSGVTLDDCQVVSEELSDELDKVDPIEQSYFLEVSSPGLERPLKKESDFIKFQGEQVEVKLFQPIDGKKLFEGELAGFENNMISIKQADGTVLEFERGKTASVRRMVKF